MCLFIRLQNGLSWFRCACLKRVTCLKTNQQWSRLELSRKWKASKCVHLIFGNRLGQTSDSLRIRLVLQKEFKKHIFIISRLLPHFPSPCPQYGTPEFFISSILQFLRSGAGLLRPKTNTLNFCFSGTNCQPQNLTENQQTTLYEQVMNLCGYWT